MREPGEAPERTAHRELEEETGFKAAHMEYLGQSYASPGYTDEVVELFFAETEMEAGAMNLDQDERVQVEALSLERFTEAMQQNDIRDSKSIAAWALAQSKGLI